MNETQLRATILLGKAMREAQLTYFRTRRDDDLRAAKALEAKFDQAARESLGPTPKQGALFEEVTP